MQKLLIIGVFLFILWNLGAGLYYMMLDKGKSTRMVRSLSWRIGISVVLILLIVIANLLGWIEFHGVGSSPRA